MKNAILKGMTILAASGMLAGCSSDYLEVGPVSSISTSVVQTTEDGVRYAVQGACQSMYFIVDDFFGRYMMPNGEPYIQAVYGEVMGQDYFSLMGAQTMGGTFMWQANTLADGWLVLQGWSYCYNIINQVNLVLDGIDNIEGNVDNLKYYKAQALTLRAHSYFRLLQLYAPRWQDSENGERYSVVLRTTSSIEDVPLAKMKDVLAQIYKDLETAEALFQETSVTRGAAYRWQPNLDVARGIHARAAMLCEDWETAQKMAHDARQGYAIMTPNEYRGGFYEPNGEWIWVAHEQDTNLGYYAYGSMFACNGPYPGVWGLGAGAINYELYRKFPQNDIRKEFFFTPDKLVGNKVQPAAFWNERWIAQNTMDLNTLNDLMIAQIKAYQREHRPVDESGEVKEGVPEAYTNFQTGSSSSTYVVFGAQYKIWARDNYGSGDVCMMRAAEMLLNEAEAAYHNHDEATAKANLLELNAQRNPDYTCNLSGEALLDEIRLQRRFELWGEGFNWFDLKRWNLPLERNPWVARDVNSNNVPRQYSMTKDANDAGWKYAVPMAESRYNKLVDRSLVDN